MSEGKSLLLAAFLSALTVIAWQFFSSTSPSTQNLNTGTQNNHRDLPVEIHRELNRKSSLSETSEDRMQISTDKLNGSILLKGAKFDDITLTKYHINDTPDSDEVVLLSPTTSDEAYFAEFGWVSLQDNITLPNSDTLWEADKKLLSKNETVNLQWDNDEGLLFKITIKADDQYLFHVEQRVTNNTNKIVKVIPYGRLNRTHPVNQQPGFVFHEGPITTFDDKFEETSYDKIKKRKSAHVFRTGWLGFSDKYWFAAIVPFSSKPINAHMKYTGNKYQLDFAHNELIVEPNTTINTFSYLFAGAKNINILDHYAKSLNIKSLDRVVDFGILYFITKPLFLLLQYLNSLLGNFGLAILVLTVFMRIVLLPLSIKATTSMLKMKKIKPELHRVKQLYANDKVQLNKEVMSLFKKHHITPMAGLLPSLLQIPMFFALYKVLSITIEMRQAPFYGWIKDLSIKDPTNAFTLFGALDWSPPQILSIGVLPILLGLTMILQQKTSNAYQPYNSSAQADVMKVMPYLFAFLFAGFPAGLVLYWVWNNLLSISQQAIITKLKFKNE